MTSYDFGYSPVWTHAHLVPFALAALFTLIALWRRWPRWLAIGGGLIAIWSMAGFLIVQVIMKANSPLDLPTEAFLPSGSGEVIDVGAGSGRSTVMVLLARPQARVTALDIYSGYFGISGYASRIRFHTDTGISAIHRAPSSGARASRRRDSRFKRKAQGRRFCTCWRGAVISPVPRPRFVRLLR